MRVLYLREKVDPETIDFFCELLKGHSKIKLLLKF